MQPTAPVTPKFDIAGAEDSKENDCYGRMKCDLFSRKQSRRHSVGGSFFFCMVYMLQRQHLGDPLFGDGCWAFVLYD